MEHFNLKGFILTIMLLCAAACFLPAQRVSAAEAKNVNKLAYVDTEAKSLVLQFDHFSEKKSYTYKLTCEGDVIKSGKASVKGSYALGSFYKENTAYVLQITSAEKETLTVRYYTGAAVKGSKYVSPVIGAYKVAQADEKVKNKWSLKDTTVYDGYCIYVNDKGGCNYRIGKKLTGGDTKAVNYVGSSLESGEYDSWLIAYKNIDNKKHAGEGIRADLSYIQKPGKVSGLTVTPDTKKAKLSWTAAQNASYYRVYKGTTPTGTFKLVMDKVTATSCVITGLKGGSKYYFKVEPVATYKSKTLAGSQTAAKGVNVPLVAGKITGLEFMMDSKNNIGLKWKKTDHAYGYRIYYKEVGTKTYKKLGATTKTSYTLNKLTADKDYKLVLYAVTKVGSKHYRSDEHSVVVKFNPVKDKNKLYNKLLAKRVRTIGYVGTTRCIYTTKKYSTAVKTAFVNARGYSSSSKYLIWISHYTQQVSIFKGKKGNWKMFKTFTVSTGTARNHSPRGTFKISYKERGWFYVSTKCLYVTHWCGRNSFHTRPLWNSGEVEDPTIGRPASHGCVRCYNSDALYIYNNMPRGTTVVSY